MKKLLAVAVVAAVMGLGFTSFADLGSAMQNAANKTANKAADKASDKAVNAASKKMDGDKAATPAADTKTAKKGKKHAKKAQ